MIEVTEHAHTRPHSKSTYSSPYSGHCDLLLVWTLASTLHPLLLTAQSAFIYSIDLHCMSHERCTYASVIFEHQLLTCNWSFLDLDMPFSLALTFPNDQPPPGSCLLNPVLMSLLSGGLPHSVTFRGPTLHSNPFPNLFHLTLL